jgi:hypothetical protein
MNCKITLTLLAAALCVGCACATRRPKPRLAPRSSSKARPIALDARRSGLGENEIRGLRDRLQKAGLTPASAETAKLVVTLSSDLRSSSERGHTGGKNGVAYDRHRQRATPDAVRG